MKGIYNVTRAQLIALIVFGFAFWIYMLVQVVDSYEASLLFQILIFALPAVFVFYILGWNGQSKEPIFKGKRADHVGVVEIGKREIVFYNPGVLKFVLLSVCTLGLYDIYWSYKNWENIKKAENSDIYPFWRAIFTVIFVFPLAKRITHSAIYRGKRVPVNYIILGVVVVLTYAVADVEGGAWLLSFSSVVPLAYLQHLALFSNKKLNGTGPNKEFSATAKAYAVIGAVILLFAIWGTFAPEDDVTVKNISTQSEQATRTAEKITIGNESVVNNGVHYSFTMSDVGKAVYRSFGATEWDPYKTEGKFIIADLTLNNQELSEKNKFGLSYVLIDQDGRRFDSMKDENCGDNPFFVTLKPGIPCTISILFEVSPLSELFYLEVTD